MKPRLRVADCEAWLGCGPSGTSSVEESRNATLRAAGVSGEQMKAVVNCEVHSEWKAVCYYKQPQHLSSESSQSHTVAGE